MTTTAQGLRLNKFEKLPVAPITEPSVTPGQLDISFAEFVALIAALIALTALSIDIMLPALPALGVSSENDRLGRKPVLLAGLAIFIAGTLGALLSGSFKTLLAARLIQGLGAASPRVVAMAVVRDRYSGREMARVMSFAMMVFIIIPVLAPSVGQGLLHLGDWRWTFYALFALGLAYSRFWDGAVTAARSA